MAHDILRKLINNSQMALDDGVYDVAKDQNLSASDHDLAFDIKTAAHAAVISEIKFASPSEGKLRTVSDPASIAMQMTRGGAKGLSVLTQPHLFGGSPEYFIKVRQAVDIPMLMKDIIIDKRQIDAASCMGADYILLVQSIFQSGVIIFPTDESCIDNVHSDDHFNLHSDNNDDSSSALGKTMLYDFIKYAHEKNLGVLLEVHTLQEYVDATYTAADIIGINNRNLDTLEIDINVTRDILDGYQKLCSKCDDDDNILNRRNNNHNHNSNDSNNHRVILSESGILSPTDVRTLQSYGADGFLIGSSIMKSNNIQEAVYNMVNSY